MPREALARLTAPDGGGFTVTDASYGAAVTAAGAAPFAFDIPLDRAATATLLLAKTASAREAAPGDAIQYRLSLVNRGATTATGLRLADTLPSGLRYERGSTRGVDEPEVSADGRTLTFAPPPLAAGASTELRYRVTVAPGAPVGEAINRARVTGPASSNEAAAAVRLRAPLFTDALTIIGRVSEGACGSADRRGVPGIRLLLEDGSFVVTDRDGLYHLEGVVPGRHVLQLDRASLGTAVEPIACERDTRAAGDAASRFVEGEGGLVRRVDFHLRATGRSNVAAPIAVADDAAAAGNRDWLAGQAPGTDWLFPGAGHNPRAPAVRVAIKHAPGERVALTLGGAPVEALAFDGTDTAGPVAVSRWSGVPLEPGPNRLAARILAPDGRIVATLDRVVHLSGVATRAEFAPQASRLVADGLTRPVVAVRVTDKDGHPVRAGTLVPFRVDPPHVAAIEVALQQQRQLAGTERAGTVARVVGDDGIAPIELEPTTRNGAVRLVVDLAEERQNRTSEVRAWLSGAAGEWTVVGFGAGSVGFDVLSRRARALPRHRRDRFVTDGQLAFYAKGRIRGSWLLTIAFDSERRADPDRGLLGTIDPDRYYTVYGDGTTQGYDAPTRRRLYLRLERREAYALFGDVETGFTDTELTRYNRTLTGAKAAYEGRRVRAAGFAAHADTRYARDEIQGNGLSGPYRLGTRGIVAGSDKLRIEVRDRFRSERIVSSTALTRHIDYDIDVDAGTLRFREPVLSRDAQLNPRFIVADYEVGRGGAGKLVAGGRVATALGAVEVGAAVIRDETAGVRTVAGVDLTARLGRATELRGEAATGGGGRLGRDTAFIAEVEHRGRSLDLLAYARQQDLGFGLGQQNAVEAGTRKVGLDARVRLDERLSLSATGWAQERLGGAGERVAGDLRLEHRRDTGTAYLGVQFADDRGVDGGSRRSRLLTLGGTQTLFDGALSLGGQTQVAPGGDRSSVDFPVRHQLTAAYRLQPGVRLLGGYEIAQGADFTAHTAQLGFEVQPWTGARLTNTLNQQAVGEDGRRSFARYGLTQSLTLGRRWSVDATLDASTTLRGAIDPGAVVSPFQPVASGGFLGQDQRDGDYRATTLGATYRAERWSWNGRAEWRAADANDRIGLTSNVLRSLGEGRTLAGSVRAFRLRDRSGAIAAQVAGDVALAWRPPESRWSVLERFELRHERADAGVDGSFDGGALGVPATGGDQVTMRAINNLALTWRSGAEGAGHRVEASVYHGAKYVRGRFADDRYDGVIQVGGFSLRRDLGERLDLGVQASASHAWTSGALAFSGGPSVGLSPAPDLWITAGYNVAGYRDPDFDDDRYTRKGPYLTMRYKFDRSTLAGAAALLGVGR